MRNYIVIALQLLTGTNDGTESVNRYKNVAFVPLGTQLIAGPGAIVAVIMRFASLIQKILGDGVELVTRIAGLLLSAIAVKIIADAVRDFVGSWS